MCDSVSSVQKSSMWKISLFLYSNSNKYVTHQTSLLYMELPEGTRTEVVFFLPG